MSIIDETFHSLYKEIFANGKEYANKNRGVSRLQIPSYTLRHNLQHSFPALSLRRLFWRGVVAELIWFLRGDNDVAFLNENRVPFWNKDAYNWYCKEIESEIRKTGAFMPTLTFDEFQAVGRGSVGQNYSVQWRKFNGDVDQIAELLKGMKKDIMSSRLKVNAWNPAELDQTALPPCHSEFQVIGVPFEDETFGFELHWNQRSTDVLLGLPINVASYALLAEILGLMTGFTPVGVEGTIKAVHFYDNQYDAARKILDIPTLKHSLCALNKEKLEQSEWLKIWKETGDLDKAFNAMQVSDFELVGYTCEPSEKVEMLAPKKI